jgi:hypothetical protein
MTLSQPAGCRHPPHLPVAPEPVLPAADVRDCRASDALCLLSAAPLRPPSESTPITPVVCPRFHRASPRAACLGSPPGAAPAAQQRRLVHRCDPTSSFVPAGSLTQAGIHIPLAPPQRRRGPGLPNPSARAADVFTNRRVRLQCAIVDATEIAPGLLILSLPPSAAPALTAARGARAV